ncbi:MAG: hypothetical protein Q9187_004802 [Circinaria calcarea]
MAAVNRPSGTQLASGGVALPPTPEKIQAKFDLSIALALHAWPALSLAVQNSWGGPESSEKRDWFAGAISDLIAAAPDADVEYVEEFLLNVMNDEFDANLEDGSAEEVAAKIVGLRKLTLQGDFALVDEMQRSWEERQRRGGRAVEFQLVEEGQDKDETDWDSDHMDEGEDADDAEMADALEFIRAPREKVQPEVDNEGFTKVVGKKKR